MDRIVCVSRGVRDDLVKNWDIPGGRTVIIHNPVEIDRVQRMAGDHFSHPWFEARYPVIAACGRLSVQKNYPLLLRAVKIAGCELPDLRLMVLGAGELREELKALAAELGIADKGLFMGFVENPFRIMARAKALGLSSSWEGFGSVLIEAMACGTPIISTLCPSGPEEIISD